MDVKRNIEKKGGEQGGNRAADDKAVLDRGY
jgi:hypothetical protein